MDPVEPGLACGSDTSHLSIFGYDPRTIYRGRGAFESMGAGLPMQPGKCGKDVRCLIYSTEHIACSSLHTCVKRPAP